MKNKIVLYAGCLFFSVVSCCEKNNNHELSLQQTLRKPREIHLEDFLSKNYGNKQKDHVSHRPSKNLSSGQPVQEWCKPNRRGKGY